MQRSRLFTTAVPQFHSGLVSRGLLLLPVGLFCGTAGCSLICWRSLSASARGRMGRVLQTTTACFVVAVIFKGYLASRQRLPTRSRPLWETPSWENERQVYGQAPETRVEINVLAVLINAMYTVGCVHASVFNSYARCLSWQLLLGGGGLDPRGGRR